jgi:hypothetical protein
MTKRYEVILTSLVFDSDAEYSTIHKNTVGATDNLEHAFRIAFLVCRDFKKYELKAGEYLEYIKIKEGDQLIAMANFMIEGDGPDSHYILDWQHPATEETLETWKDAIEKHEWELEQNGTSDFIFRVTESRIALIKDKFETQAMGSLQPLRRHIFKAEEFMGFRSTKSATLESELGL